MSAGLESQGAAKRFDVRKEELAIDTLKKLAVDAFPYTDPIADWERMVRPITTDPVWRALTLEPYGGL